CYKPHGRCDFCCFIDSCSPTCKTSYEENTDSSTVCHSLLRGLCGTVENTTQRDNRAFSGRERSQPNHCVGERERWDLRPNSRRRCQLDIWRRTRWFSARLS